MKGLKKDLQALGKGLQALAKKTEALAKQLEKAQPVKAKPVKKAAPGKKAAPVKAKPVKKAAPVKAKAVRKAPVKKKAAGITDTDKVLNIIKRSKKGVPVQTLIEKTGFNAKKVANIVFRAFKEGKIKRAGKGIYTS